MLRTMTIILRGLKTKDCFQYKTVLISELSLHCMH